MDPARAGLLHLPGSNGICSRESVLLSKFDDLLQKMLQDVANEPTTASRMGRAPEFADPLFRGRPQVALPALAIQGPAGRAGNGAAWLLPGMFPIIFDPAGAF
jgi:hypothetical protein